MTFVAADPTTSSPAVPTWVGVALSVALVLIAVAVAVREQLGVAREMLIAAARAGVQLVAIGAILLALFEHAGIGGALGWLAVMVVIAGRVAGRRGRGLPRSREVATIAIAFGSAATVGVLVLFGVIESSPRVIVPIGGMVVSGAMQATSLVLARIRDETRSARAKIEARLCLGLPAHEAFRPHLRLALRTALIPTIDSTKVVGLISLPGAMTGLILAGVDPLKAIRVQIVVMYMLLAAWALAALAAGLLAQRLIFDDADRLL